jgi:NADPH:quinone reductase
MREDMRRAALASLAVAAVYVAVACVAPRVVAAASPLPETMAVAAIDQGGGPEVLSIHRLPVPAPKAGEVLIAVQYAGVGAWEAGIRENPGSGAQFPMVLGSDGSGTVAAVGLGVQGFKVGDRVYGTSDAFYAQYVAVPAESVAHIPRGIALPEAGILAISGLSALQGIDDVLQLQAGESLIVHGATGGVGTLAIQFAKRRGARVLATASSEEGLALARRLGADAVVDGRAGDVAAAARQFAPRGVDAVLALAGGAQLEQCIDALRRDGRGRVAYLYGMNPLPRPRFNIRMTLYSFIAGSREFERLNRIVEAGRTEVPIAADYPLADAAAAHRRLEAGHLLGKIELAVH